MKEKLNLLKCGSGGEQEIITWRKDQRRVYPGDNNKEEGNEIGLNMVLCMHFIWKIQLKVWCKGKEEI